jgi:hypothetical protein
MSLRLGDVCTKIGSGATPRGGSEVYLSTGVALPRLLSGKVRVGESGGQPTLEALIRGRTKLRRKLLAWRFKDPDDEFRLAIVVDMWLTGFDVPCAIACIRLCPASGRQRGREGD